MKKLSFFWLIMIIFLFREVIFTGFVAVPTDTLVGANLPWRDYTWGYITGVPVKNPPLSDVFSQFFVWKHLAADLIRSGHFPLWNRFSFSGNALLATYHTSVLFPATLFLVIFPRFWGWNLYILLSTFCAGIFMAWYLKSRLKSTPAILTGSVIYALSGLMTTWVELGTAVWAMAIIPLLLLVIDRFYLRPKNLYLVSTSSLVLLIILAGNVQITTYLIFLIPLYLALVHRWNKTAWRIMTFLVLGLGLAAIQFFPTLEFYRSSIRDTEQFSATINYGLTGWGEFIRLWAPDFFGNPVTYNHWGPTSYHENSSFLGAVGVVLVVTYLLNRHKSRLGKFSVIILVASLVLGYVNPISHWLFSQNLPLLTFSSASRIFFLTTFSTALLSALAVEKRRSNFIVPVIFIFLTVIFLATVPHQYFTVSLRNVVIPVLVFLVLGTLAFFSRLRKFLPLVILILIILEMGRYFRKYNPFVPSRLVFPSTPVIKYLAKQSSGYRFINESDEIIPPNTWSYYGLESPEGYDPLYSINYTRLFKVAAGDNYFAKPHRYLDMTNARPDYLDILSVKYLVSKTRSDDYLTPIKAKLLPTGWQKEYEDKSTEIYANPHVLPRAFSLTSFRNFETESELAAALESSDFFPKSTVAFYPPVTDIPPVLALAKINKISPIANGLDIRYLATDSALILVSQSYDPAWKAAINRISVPVYRADGGLLAVLVPPGANMLLKLRYFPDALLWGAVVSALCGILILTGVKIRL